jgi:hypothetical protein
MRKRDTQREKAYRWERRLAAKRHDCATCGSHLFDHRKHFVIEMDPKDPETLTGGGHYEEAKVCDHVYVASLPKFMRKLDLVECEEIVNMVRADYGLGKISRVTDGRRRRSGCYEPWEHVIKLPRWTRVMHYVLHETAHSMVPGQYAWHGPEFVRLLAELFARYTEVSMPVSRAMAKECHVKMARKPVREPLLRREVKRLAAIKEERRALSSEIDRLRSRIIKLDMEAHRLRGDSGRTYLIA